MPLKSYAVLKGRAKDKLASAQHHPHFHIWLTADGRDYRAAINVRSMQEPSAMQYLLKFRWRHPITADLSSLKPGLHLLDRHGGAALDYIRLNLFHPDRFLTLPCSGPGCGGDISDVMDGVVGGAVLDPDCWVYVFGEPWETHGADKIFPFFPTRGMHEVHMNQGNDPVHWSQDGVWQDGAILFEHPRQQRWTGLFLKFQSQSWHTDDATGHPAAPAGQALETQYGQPPAGAVRIVAVLVHPHSRGQHGDRPESVMLLNVSPDPVDLTGWTLQNRARQTWRLHGNLAPGQPREVPLGAAFPLGSAGGIVTLLDGGGFKMHGVSFTAEQASRDGWRIAF